MTTTVVKGEFAEGLSQHMAERRKPLQRGARRGIGRAEMEVLDYIQQHHPTTVREVADHVSRTKGHVRTTVLNVMTRLCRKGYLTRERVAGVYRYSPRVSRGELLQGLIGDFVEKVLGGSVSPFVAYLARDAELSDEDLRQLKGFVRDLDRPEDGPEGRADERAPGKGGAVK